MRALQQEGNVGTREGGTARLVWTPPSRAVQLKNISKAKTGTKIVPPTLCQRSRRSRVHSLGEPPLPGNSLAVVLKLWLGC